MATRLAILATAKAIRRLLAEAGAGTEFSGAEFKVIQAAELTGATPPLAEGITICLYQITANTQRNTPAHTGPTGARSRPALALELHFLITPWSASADTQLSLLGWAMRVLDDTPSMDANVLNADFPGQAIFHLDESVALIFNPLSLPELAALWQGLAAAGTMPAITYVARLVSIESDTVNADGAAEPDSTWITAGQPE